MSFALAHHSPWVLARNSVTSRYTIFLLASAVAVGCDKSSAPMVSEVVPAVPVASLVADPDAVYWDQFNVDVSVKYTGSIATLNVQNPESGVGYRMMKYLSGGRWVADFNHGPYLPSANSPGNMDPPRIVGADGADGCVTPILYDAYGAQVTIPTPSFNPVGSIPAGASAPPISSSRPAVGSSPGCNQYSLQSVPSTGSRSFNREPRLKTAAAAVPGPSRDWIGRYVVTPASAGRARAKLAAKGVVIPEVGRTRFRMSRGADVAEIIFNEARGTVDEVLMFRNGKLQSRTQRTYAQQSNGILLLRSERVTYVADEGRKSLAAIETTFSNIQLSEAP